MTNANKILKICAMYNSIKGKQSFFVETRGTTGSGKTFENKQVLSCFDSSDIIQVNDLNYTSLFGEEYKFDKKIIFLGDMDNYNFKRMKKVFIVFKTLMINHKYSGIVCKKEQTLSVESLCVIYETLKNITNSKHILNPSLHFTTKLGQDELLDKYIESFGKIDGECDKSNEEEKLLNYYREQIKKCRKLNIKVQHNFNELFDSEIREPHISNPIHKLEQLLLLFESYVELNSSIDSDCIIEATKEQYIKFISLVHESGFMEDNYC